MGKWIWFSLCLIYSGLHASHLHSSRNILPEYSLHKLWNLGKLLCVALQEVIVVNHSPTAVHNGAAWPKEL